MTTTPPPRQHLTKTQVNAAKVSYILTITGLLVKTAAASSNPEQSEEELLSQPAVVQCTTMVSELLDPLTPEVRYECIERINQSRVWLTRQTRAITIEASLIATLRVLTSDLFLSRPGTRFDYLRQTFRDNLKGIEQVFVGVEQKHVTKFERQLRRSLEKLNSK